MGDRFDTKKEKLISLKPSSFFFFDKFLFSSFVYVFSEIDYVGGDIDYIIFSIYICLKTMRINNIFHLNSNANKKKEDCFIVLNGIQTKIFIFPSFNLFIFF